MQRDKLLLAILCASAATIAIYKLKFNKKRNKRRWWVRPIYENRRRQGHGYHLLQELRNDDEMFFNYTRMSVETFDYLLYLVGPRLKKYSYRTPIPEMQRLALTLR